MKKLDGGELRGHHSVFFRDNRMVRKILEPQYPFIREEVELWKKRIEVFYDHLRRLGVPVVPEHHVVINGDNSLIEHSTDGGVDFQELLIQGRITPQQAVEEILAAIAGVLDQAKPQVGIDAQPAHWCLADGQVTYVDYHPPYYMEDGVPLVGFPQPAEADRELNFQRHYSPLGIIRSLRFNIVRLAGKEGETAFCQAIKDYPTLAEQLSLLIVEVIRQQPERLPEIIAPWNLERVNDLREIAMFCYPELVNPVLQLTMVDFRISREVRRQRFEEAKQLFLQHC